MKRFLSIILACALALSMSVTALASESSFTDIPANADYAEAVAWCQEKGLMQGVSDSRFDPEGTLTRAMVAAVLYRAEGEPAVTGNPDFADTQADQWYSDAIIWANEKGIVYGYGNGLFGTNDPVTKEQLDVMIHRYNGENPTWTGDPALNVPATRAEAAVAFYTYLNQEPAAQDAKILVVYYSATGSTENVANYIAGELNADTFELVPADDYSSADLNWSNSSSRVNAEHNDESKRDIELVKTTPDHWEDYDVVFVGYPIWWGIAAWPVNNFVKDNDFTGKTVIPFCTSSSSGLGQSGELLAEMAGEGDWQTGQRFQSSANQSTVIEWVRGLGLSAAIPAVNGKTLVVYFLMPDNVDDSTVAINGQILGNTQYMAQVIQETTGGDIFRIESVTPYPTDHAALVDLASQEQSENARPAIQDTIADFDSYDTIFVGYPIWWSDMPMILYSFFDSYDFSGKTLIPFGTHGGSGWAGTPAKIAQLEPNANMLDGLTISRNVIEDARQEIVAWVKGLDI